MEDLQISILLPTSVPHPLTARDVLLSTSYDCSPVYVIKFQAIITQLDGQY